jgi:probable HAF family extracellular repeat protein
MKAPRPVQAAQDTQRAAENLERFDVIDLGPFDNNRNDVLALNDVAQSAGVSLNPETGRIEAFRQADGARSMLGTLGGSFSIAHDLNNQGEVVGGSLTEGDENFHGFLYRDNRLRDLNEFLDPGTGWELLQGLGINNHGEIIAIGSNTGQDRIVLLRPRA